MNKFNTHGGYFAPHNYTRVNVGGSHDENPNGGVQLGVDSEGVPNMLEEGEPVYDDFVFSDNIKANKKFLKENGIPEKYAGRLFSKIADDYIKEAEMNPNDPISNNGLEAMLSRLANAQESQKAAKAERDVSAELQQLSPEEMDMIRQALVSGGGQMPMEQGMSAEQGVPMEQMQPVQEQMPVEEQMPVDEQMLVDEQMPMMACGGRINRFGEGSFVDINPNVSPAGDEVSPEALRLAMQEAALETASDNYPPVQVYPSPADSYTEYTPDFDDYYGGLGALEYLTPGGALKAAVSAPALIGTIVGKAPRVAGAIVGGAKKALKSGGKEALKGALKGAKEGAKAGGRAIGKAVKPVTDEVDKVAEKVSNAADKVGKEYRAAKWDAEGKLVSWKHKPLHGAAKESKIKSLEDAREVVHPKWSDLSTGQKIGRVVKNIAITNAIGGAAIGAGELIKGFNENKEYKQNKNNSSQDYYDEEFKANGGRINRFIHGGTLPEISVEADRKQLFEPDAIALLNGSLGDRSIVYPSEEQIKRNIENTKNNRRRMARQEIVSANDDSDSLSTLPQYAGALSSVASMLYNLGQEPDRYEYQAYNPALPTGDINLIDPEYNPIDVEMASNGVLASGAGNARALLNSGVGASLGSNIIALDNNIGRNLGTARTQIVDTNNQRRNQILQQRNANRAQSAQFSASINERRAQALNDAKLRNMQNILSIMQLNNAAEGEKYAAVQTGLDQASQFLSQLGTQNRNMNFYNSDETSPYGIGYNGIYFKGQ